MKDQILEEFKNDKQRLDSFRDRILNLLQDLLRHDKVYLHQINCRTKDLESLSKKIDKKEGKYKSLKDITDIVGIRIITYLESDVDRVAYLIGKEFAIDEPNSSDKRDLKIDQFGYKSLHIVISLNEKRSNLTEYSSYKELKCEIQIRSILQHAWAEIEHDLGYKSKSAIPETYVRNFNRLAALLETADIEFDRLKKELTDYEREVSKQIKEKPEQVLINQASLSSFISTNDIFIEAKNIIAKLTGAEIYEANDYQGMLGRFDLFKIKTIKDLENSILLNKDNFLSFIKVFIGDYKSTKLPSSLPLYYYQHFLASKTEDLKFINHYFNSEIPVIGNSEESAQNFINIYRMSK